MTGFTMQTNFSHFQYCRLVQSVFLLPRYLERNHDRIAKSFEKRGLLGDDDETTEFVEDQTHEQPSSEQSEGQSKKTD